MTDSSLDDFFAKKDKKKKNKSKFTGSLPSDILAKQNEEPAQLKPEPQRKQKRPEKEKSQNSQQSTPATNTAQGAAGVEEEDEEWKDYEQETEKDYTGLRIQNLQISKEEEDEADEVGETEIDEDGEVREKKDSSQGPWNKLQGGATPAAAPPPPPEPEPQPEPEKEPEAPKSVGKYIPPSMRRAAGASESSPLTPQVLGHRGGGGAGRKKQAPDLQNPDDFPVLGRGPVQQQTPSVWGQPSPGDTRFEKVRSGGRLEDPRSQRPQLELGNKFDALGRGDMD